jgi:hypothetical protein
MLPGNILNAIRTLLYGQHVAPPATAELGPSTLPAAPFEPGRSLLGLVLAEVSPGTFRVRVADMQLQMSLPERIQPGDEIELSVLSLRPRLTFSLTASANPISTQDEISGISRLLCSFAERQPENTPGTIIENTALWTSELPPQAGQLAGLLQESFNRSGLFYESHQAQWLQGSRSTAQLREEPQHNPSVMAELAQTRAVKTTAPTPADRPMPWPAPATALRQDGQTSMNMPPHVQTLVQQQLHVLETRQLLWHGEVWPGQAMRWKLQESPPQQADTEAMTKWRTHLALDLPKLGEVNATLIYSNSGLELSLSAADLRTRDLLAESTAELLSLMSNAGIPVANPLVVQHEPAD